MVPLGATDGAPRSTVAAPSAAAHGRVVHGLGAAALAAGESAGHHRTLRDGVDLAIGAAQRGEHQDAALQIAGVSDGGRRDVQMHAGLGEGRQGRRHQNRGRIGDADRGWATRRRPCARAGWSGSAPKTSPGGDRPCRRDRPPVRSRSAGCRVRPRSRPDLSGGRPAPGSRQRAAEAARGMRL